MRHMKLIAGPVHCAVKNARLQWTAGLLAEENL